MHLSIEPSILYFGTPVILVSTLNEDRTLNIAPMSSAWWLGWNCMLGLGSSSQTAKNLTREKECVLNLPSVAQVDAVDLLANLQALIRCLRTRSRWDIDTRGISCNSPALL